MKQLHIVHLQQEIVQVFGHPVLSFSDCIRLAEAIFERTGLKISVNTLRRFFNLIAAKYPPSYNTLTILSKACGYHSYSEFVQVWEERSNRAEGGDVALLKYMVSLFQQIPVASVQDDTYNNLVHLTISYLRSHAETIDAFQKKIARTKNGQDFYFERFINTDALDGYYGNGLRFYLNEKKDPAAQLFGHSLLCFRYWLTGDEANFSIHFKQASQQASPLPSAYPVQSHFFAARLFHAHIYQLQVESILEEARYAVQQPAQAKENIKTFPRFELILAGALVLTGQFDEALFYIAQVGKKRGKYAVADEEKLLFRAFDVYEVLAWAGLGKRAKAEKLYEGVKKGPFYFIDQKFLSALLSIVERLLKKRTYHADKFAVLVEELGFRRLKTLFAEPNGSRIARPALQ